LANVFYQASLYDSAFNCNSLALHIQETIQDSDGMARSYGNIAGSLYAMQEYKRANDYLLLSVGLYKSRNNINGIAVNYSNVVVNFIKLKDYDQAFRYSFMALEMYDKVKDTVNAISVYQNLGNCYYLKKNNDSAMYWYKKALFSARRLNNKAVQMGALSNIGDIAYDLCKYKDAEDNYRELLSLAEGLGYLDYLYYANRDLARLFAKTGDYKNAYNFKVQASIYKDSMLNEDKMKALTSLTAKFETQQVENKNVSLQKENRIQKLNLQRKDIILYSGGALLVLLLAFGWILVRNNRLVANQKLMQLEQKQLLAQINPHFIFNCLNSVQQFVVQNDIINANKYLSDFAMLMRQTLENSKDGIISLSREMEYLQNYLSLEAMRFEDKFSYSIICAGGIDPETIEIPSMIIQPFIENAIQHGLRTLSGKGGVLKIQFRKRGKNLFCEVDDNGIGIEASRKMKEQMFIKHQSHGMELTQKRLELVGKLSKTNYGISIINKKNEKGEPDGTMIIIKFPI
jgi:tetratricopeptide (TPR) repeat protein